MSLVQNLMDIKQLYLKSNIKQNLVNIVYICEMNDFLK